MKNFIILFLALSASLGSYGLQAGSSSPASPEPGEILKTGVAAPERSERLRSIKDLIRQDLNAVRRARYALKRAQKSQDPRAEATADQQLREVKEKLKKDRTTLRELLSEQRSRKQVAEPKRRRVKAQSSPSQQPELLDSVADRAEERPAWLQPAKEPREIFP